MTATPFWCEDSFLRSPEVSVVNWRHVGLWTCVKANMAKQFPLQAQRPVSIKDAKGRPLSQTDTPARPSAEHSAHAVGPTASHTGCHASQGLSSTQHSARLPVTRPEWMTYRRGLATACRGCWRHPGLHVPSWRDSSAVAEALVVQIYKAFAFGYEQLQPDQPV